MSNEVRKHLWLGSLFASIIVYFFLGTLRATLIAAVSIPVAIISTYTLLAAAGYSLNRITLLDLTLAVGMWLSSFGFTMAFAIAVSLLVAFR
jgi:hydrophobic/amphiphilic exporter-1 (mainly G- bacteria), HAE1 family